MTATPTEQSVRFRDLNLIPPLLEALDRLGYVNPSPIQAAVIPVAMLGHDVIGQAQTGTGKTAAFLLPFMNAWRGGDPYLPQGIIMLPTRELAMQVAEEAKKLAPSKYFRTVAVYGGQRYGRQQEELAKGCTLLVGTPGRLHDFLQRGTISLEKIKLCVLDEADRMLDIGFRPQIERILRRMPQSRQTLLMSATLSEDIMKLSQRYMMEPKVINVSPPVLTVDRIDQSFITVDEEKKLELLGMYLTVEQPRQCIIFTERKRGADRLQKNLKTIWPGSIAIHGDLAQTRREKIMAAYRAGTIKCLIATDVMSRGIDVSGISHIINYDLPNDLENYVHRIGRTGRMGADGRAVSFVTPEQGKQLSAIEELINRLIPEVKFDGFEAFRPRLKEEKPADAPSQPVYGRRGRKHTNRL